MTKLTFRLKGGPGSGHKDHKGIPGHHGGSLPDGEDGGDNKNEESENSTLANSSELHEFRMAGFMPHRNALNSSDISYRKKIGDSNTYVNIKKVSGKFEVSSITKKGIFKYSSESAKDAISKAKSILSKLKDVEGKRKVVEKLLLDSYRDFGKKNL